MSAPLPPSESIRAWAAALRDLPLEAPEPSVWPTLAEAAARPARRSAARPRSRLAWAAAAAIAALAVSVPSLMTWQAGPGEAPSAPALADRDDADARLVADLVARNQSLERALRDTDSSWAIDAEYAMAATQVEDLIAAIDDQLAAIDDARNAEVLWRVRLSLLQELATLRTGGAESLIAGTHGVIAVPADYEIQ